MYRKELLIFSLILLVVGSFQVGCDQGIIGVSKSTSQLSSPTQSANSEDSVGTPNSSYFLTNRTPLSIPTVQPIPSPTLSTVLADELTPQSMFFQEMDWGEYQHPNGLFSLKVPEEWLKAEDDSSATFSDAAGDKKLLVTVINNGLNLDEDIFQRVINAREKTLFETYEGYFEREREIDVSGKEAIIEKQFVLAGVPKVVTTAYYQSEQIVMVIDLWSDLSEMTEHDELFVMLTNGASLDYGASSQIDVTSLRQTHQVNHGNLTLDVPNYWQYRTTSAEYSVVQTISSPDEHLVIQLVTYDDGQQMSKNIASNFALLMLRDFYSTDIRITSDTMLADGRERLVWESVPANYQGVTYFETDDTTLLIFTILIDDEYIDFYEDMLLRMARDEDLQFRRDE